MRILSADIIYTCAGPPVPDAVVVVEDDGAISEVIDPASEIGRASLSRLPAPEHHEGILCPGFINAHCHLELSWMRGRIPTGGGLPAFIRSIVTERRDGEEAGIKAAIGEAEKEMMDGGIVGVGDICNTKDTLEVKWKHRIRYHNFIELFDFDPSRTDVVMEEGETLARQFANTLGGDEVSLVPHAPYSVTRDLLKRLYACAYDAGTPLSIHNQETRGEDEMFVSGSGALLDTMKAFGLPATNRWPTGFSSLASTIVHLPKCNNILLVHNTYSTQQDVDRALEYSDRLWWCLCPGANLYIEERLPDVDMLVKSVSGRMVIGTDSYASNTALSILGEMQTLSAHFPQLSLDELLTWATKNGAEFFGWKDMGTLEKGKKPGVNLIKGIRDGRLTNRSSVQRLL